MLNKKELEKIQNTLAPFAMIGADCEDGDTSFCVKFGEGDDIHHVVTHLDFIRAFQLSIELGRANMPRFLDPISTSDERVWPLRDANGRPFNQNEPERPVGLGSMTYYEKENKPKMSIREKFLIGLMVVAGILAMVVIASL